MKDSEFIRDKVPMTKEPIRAISIDKLNLHGAKKLLDIGAGTGSISLQTALNFPNIQVTSIEKKPKAVQLIKKNIDHFNLDNISIIEGEAPLIGFTEKNFDSIFIGGTGGNLNEIIDWSEQLLLPKGMLVLNFILQENALDAISYLQDNNCWEGFEAINVSVMDWHQLGTGHYFKPQNPTIIVCAKKIEMEKDNV